MRVIFAGDSHGDPNYINSLFAVAGGNAEAIFVVGDFGYWEHEPGGAEFLDFCSMKYKETGIKLYFLDGNHENHPMLWSRYTEKDDEGFIIVRDGLLYAPRGHWWKWGGMGIMALGGAYSVDKEFREAGKSWWPTEQLTDADIEKALSVDRPVDLLLTHDKPSMVNTPGLKDYAECMPNQQRIQIVANHFRPEKLIHGHLHRHYVSEMMVGPNMYTEVIGLASNIEAAYNDDLMPSIALFMFDEGE